MQKRALICLSWAREDMPRAKANVWFCTRGMHVLKIAGAWVVCWVRFARRYRERYINTGCRLSEECPRRNSPGARRRERREEIQPLFTNSVSSESNSTHPLSMDRKQKQQIFDKINSRAGVFEISKWKTKSFDELSKWNRIKINRIDTIGKVHF